MKTNGWNYWAAERTFHNHRNHLWDYYRSNTELFLICPRVLFHDCCLIRITAPWFLGSVHIYRPFFETGNPPVTSLTMKSRTKRRSTISIPPSSDTPSGNYNRINKIPQFISHQFPKNLIILRVNTLDSNRRPARHRREQSAKTELLIESIRDKRHHLGYFSLARCFSLVAPSVLY